MKDIFRCCHCNKRLILGKDYISYYQADLGHSCKNCDKESLKYKIKSKQKKKTGIDFSKWTKKHWDVAAWVKWREIIKKIGVGDRKISKKNLKRMYYDFDFWFDKWNKGDIQDLRGLAKYLTKNDFTS